MAPLDDGVTPAYLERYGMGSALVGIILSVLLLVSG
jgi:hypothetical protein